MQKTSESRKAKIHMKSGKSDRRHLSKSPHEYQSMSVGSRRLGSAKKIIMGVSGSWHDAAVAIVTNGRVLAAMEEERFTRRKHEPARFPVNSIVSALQYCNLHWTDVSDIAIGWNYGIHIETHKSKSFSDTFFANLDRTYASSKRISLNEVERRLVPERNRERFDMKEVTAFLGEMREVFGSQHTPTVRFVPHHAAHAASAYYSCGLADPVLVLVIDGYGEVDTATVWVGQGGNLRHIHSIQLPNSLGWYYSAGSEYLGFEPNSAEGEVMGLAPYGAPQNDFERQRINALQEIMGDVVRVSGGSFTIDSEFLYFGGIADGFKRVSRAMFARLNPLVRPWSKANGLLDPHTAAGRPAANLAYVLQGTVERVITQLVHHYVNIEPRTRNVRSVALAGGVAMNINSIGKLVRERLVESDCLFVPPAPGDAGTAIGAALHVDRVVHANDCRHHMTRADLGIDHSDAEIKEALDSFELVKGLHYRELQNDADIARVVADLLNQDKVVAWFQGRSEFGPRALGQRSILINPQNPTANLIANQIKGRQPWRPSALSTQVELAAKYLDGFKVGARASFMSVNYPITANMRGVLQSGCHSADGTTRPQTVSRKDNPLFWLVLEDFRQLTGIGAVLNTSFNRREPLVESPEEALNTFHYMAGVNALCIGRFLVTSREAIRPTIRSFADEPATAELFSNALKSSATPDWDLVLDSASQWLGCHALVADIVSSNGVQSLQWPLAREMLHGPASVPLQHSIASEIRNEAEKNGAIVVHIGATCEKLDRTIYYSMREHLDSLFARSRHCFRILRQPGRTGFAAVR